MARRESGAQDSTTKSNQAVNLAQSEASSELLRELVAHLRQNRTQLREEWVSRIAETRLLTAMTKEEIFAEATSLRQLNQTLEAEIKRIAYAVHDEAGQVLVAVNLALMELSRQLPDPQQQQVGQIQCLLNEVENHLRRYSHELRPTILDDLGWIPAIRFLAEGVSIRANLAIHVRSAFSGRLSGPVETAFYRIVQEALTNVVKHANARNVWIHAYREDHMVCCSILDDGSGFDPRHVQSVAGRKGLGLVAMQERVSAVGGTLRIKSRPGQGTELLIQLTQEADCADSRRTGR